MKPEIGRWKWPAALGMVGCSLVPIALLWCIADLELKGTVWSHTRHVPLPFIAGAFLAHHQLGFILPILTTTVAAWFVSEKFITAARLAWTMLVLVILHLFWLSFGILAFYLTNQQFVM